MDYLNILNFSKLSDLWNSFVKVHVGGVMLLVRYNEFFERNEPFGIKLSTLNLKKVKEHRGSIPFLKMLRRSSRDTYKKFTKETEVQFNIIHNEYLSANSFGLTNTNSSISNDLFDGFTGAIFSKVLNYHMHTANVATIHNVNKNTFNIKSYHRGQKNVVFMHANRAYIRIDFFTAPFH
jgi:hypothetical protein